VTNAPQSRLTEMSLKVVWSVQIQCQAAAVRRVDCSKLSDPQQRNSCHKVECLFSEQWGRWREQSEAGGIRSDRGSQTGYSSQGSNEVIPCYLL